MASINPTKFTIGADGRKRATRDSAWKVQYRDASNRSQSRAFARRADAEAFAAKVETDKALGTLTDHTAGRQPFGEYAAAWLDAQVHRASTAAQRETNLRRHILPTFSARPLTAIRPSEVQAWVRRLTDSGLAPATVEVVYRLFASVMLAAKQDRAIAFTPCEGVKLPSIERKLIAPPSVEQVATLTASLPERYRAIVTFTAGTGLRQGEVFGLTRDRLDFLRDRAVTVDRQLVMIGGGECEFGPLKTKASYRTVPMGDVVLDALASHLARFPAEPDGLVFTNDAGDPIRRTGFSTVWRPAARAAGLASGEGMHALRHFYASLLIAKGCSVKVVQSRLGHATAAETLDTYAHLWPDDDALTRTAVDAVLGATLGATATDVADAMGRFGGDLAP